MTPYETPYEVFDRMWKEEMEGGPFTIALNIVSLTLPILYTILIATQKL